MSLYIPPVFTDNDVSQLQRFIKQYGFCTVVTCSAGIRVSHLPLILLENQGEYGTLLGHMARANQQWKDFDSVNAALCIFAGPHAYISPSWYKERPEVPTWNYAVVHAQGVPHLIDSKDELQEIIDKTISYYEPALHDKKSEAYIPESYKQDQLDYIVGFKMEIESIVGKFKLGQNRSLEDQFGIIEGLSNRNDNDSNQLAKFMKDYLGHKS